MKISAWFHQLFAMQTPLFLLTMGGNMSQMFTRCTSNLTNFNGNKRQKTWKVRLAAWSGPFDLCHVLGEYLSCIIHTLRWEGRNNIMLHPENGRRITQSAANKQETNQ